MDAAATLYLIIIITHSMIFSLCLWWAIVYPKRSKLFICFTILSAGIICNFIPPFYTRLGGVEVYTECRHEWWWEFRHFPIAAVSLVILYIFIGRMLEDENS